MKKYHKGGYGVHCYKNGVGITQSQTSGMCSQCADTKKFSHFGMWLWRYCDAISVHVFVFVWFTHSFRLYIHTIHYWGEGGGCTSNLSHMKVTMQE